MKLVRVQSKDGMIWCHKRKSGRQQHVVDSWYVKGYTGRIVVSFQSWQGLRSNIPLPPNWDLAK